MASFLYIGFGSVVYLLFSPLPQEIVKMLDSSINLLNLFVQWINKQEAFFFDNLYLSELSLLLSYLLIIGLLLGHYSKKRAWFYFNSCTGIALFYSLWTGFPQREDGLWLTHDANNSLLVEKIQGRLFVYTHDRQAIEQTTLKHYQRYFGLNDTVIFPIKNSYQLGKQQLLIIDGNWIERFDFPPASIIMLCNNPKFNLASYLKKQAPEIVLIDGSNTTYYIERWKQSLLEEKIPFHVTTEQGAFNFNRGTLK